MNILSFFKRRSDDRCAPLPTAAEVAAKNLAVINDLYRRRLIRAEPNPWIRGQMTRALNAEIAQREQGAK